jgi:A/G-specific adenine glycosylase
MLAERLLEWFGASGRELPWRTPFPRDPYAVLVSEVMLQQTQVDRVKPAYARFMERFPTVSRLASADDDDVARAFSGLGYYRRVRLLRAAAHALDGMGRFPETRQALALLPGFGPYTSAAVAAFAFAGTDPPVDGNIARVTARVLALDLALGSSALLAAATEFAASLHQHRPTPAVWEALMELGATVCTPRSPRCTGCPLAPECRALALERPHAYPRPRRRRPTERHTWVVVWLERDDGRVLMRRVEEGSLLGGVWLPPFAPLAEGADPPALARVIAGEAGFGGALAEAPSIRHAITHRDIRVRPFTGRPSGLRVAEARPGWSWQRAEAPEVPTSSMLAKLATACRSAPAADAGTREG